MPNIEIANLIPLKNTKYAQYAFTLIHQGFTIPGMRIFAGAIQPPQRKNGHSWYPMLYCSPELANAIWVAAKTVYPELIGPYESTRRFLEMDDFTFRRMNLIAEAQ